MRIDEANNTQPDAGAPASEAPPTRRSPDRAMPMFALSVGAIIVVAIITNSFSSYHTLRRELAGRAIDSSPAVFNLLAHAIRRQPPLGDDELRGMADDLARLPDVYSCRISFPASGKQAERTIASVSSEGRPDGPRVQKRILSDKGEPLAVVDLYYSVARAPDALSAAATGAAIIGLAALLGFALIFLCLRRGLRPIEFVRDNLLAHHRGTETALELLTVRDTGGRSPVADAWNALIGGVCELQRELDAFRCRQAVDHSVAHLTHKLSHSILDALPIGVVHIDADERVSYCNYSAERMLDAAAADGAQDASLEARFPDAGLVKVIRSLGHAPSREQLPGASNAGYVDYTVNHAGGAEPAESAAKSVIRLTPIVIADGPDDELALLVQDVSQMIEAEKSRDAFLAHITHELRTPLTNIQAYAETLTEDLLEDEQTRHECYNVITSETRRLSRLIEDVLNVSQIESGVARFERVSVRIDESVRKVVQEVQASADAKSITLQLRVPSKVPPVMGDRMRLHQMWTNLLGNAIKYTPDGGSVTVAIQADESLVRLCVSDTGIGIAPEHHERIFEKFYRAESSDIEGTEGTGLGLPITLEIARMHGGSISVESSLGSGSTFIVELPRARETAVAGKAGG